MARTHQETGAIVVGAVLVAVAGLCMLGFLKATVLDHDSYILYAEFATVAGVHTGDPVMIAGVQVGTVETINLKEYQARLGLKIRDEFRVRSDAVASIKSSGLALAGDRLVSIDPGVSDERLGPGDVIAQTRSALSIQDLVIQLVAGDIVPGG